MSAGAREDLWQSTTAGHVELLDVPRRRGRPVGARLPGGLMHLPPLLETLGLAELTHDKRNNRIGAT